MAYIWVDGKVTECFGKMKQEEFDEAVKKAGEHA